MTASAFSLPFGPHEAHRYALRNKKISKKRRKPENGVPKLLFPHMSIVEEEYGFGFTWLPFLPVSTWLYGREADCLSIILTTKNPKNTENPVSHTGQAPGLFNPYVPLTPSADTLPAFPIHCLLQYV